MRDLLPPIPMRYLAELCRRVGTCLEVGVDMLKVWEQEMDRSPARVLPAISRVRQGLQQGIPVSEAMSGAGGAFPPIVVDVVQIGEHSGRTEQAFLQLADHYDHLLGLRRILILSSIWPMISLGLAIVIIGLFIVIMGAINSMTGQSIDILGYGLVGFSGLLKYIFFLGVVGGSLAGLVWAVRAGYLPLNFLRRVAMFIPGLRSYIQAASLSRFAWALSLATNSSMSIKQAIRLAFATSGNAYYQQHADTVMHATLQGRSIHDALQQTGAFPFEFVAMVEVGESSGRLPETLQRAATQFEAEARSRSTVLTICLSFCVWGFVALLIIAMIARLFSFYLHTIQSAGQI